MGSWSATILGGDIACDYCGEFETIAGFGGCDSRAEVKRAINARLGKLFARAKSFARQDKGSDAQGVAAQVLGVLIISNGARMTKEIRAFVLDGCDNDAWANSPDSAVDAGWADSETDEIAKQYAKDLADRRRYIKLFRKQIEKYPGKGSARGLKIPYEGLFDKIEERTRET